MYVLICANIATAKTMALSVFFETPEAERSDWSHGKKESKCQNPLNMPFEGR